MNKKRPRLRTIAHQRLKLGPVEILPAGRGPAKNPNQAPPRTYRPLGEISFHSYVRWEEIRCKPESE
jgi:hypothetical protein